MYLFIYNYDFLLQDVRYVPELEWNLVSISMFDGPDNSTRIEHGVLIFLHGALIIAKDLRMNGLCILDGFTVIDHASIASQYS
jgi:hypothetical protein